METMQVKTRTERSPLRKLRTSAHYLGLLCLVLCLLVSCQRSEAPEPSSPEAPGQTALTSLEVSFEGFDSSSTRPSGCARALSTPTGDAVTVDVLVEDGSTYIRTDSRTPSTVKSKWAHVDHSQFAQRPRVKMLLLLRKAGTNNVTYNYLDWEYYEEPAAAGSSAQPRGRYRVINVPVELPSGFAPGDVLHGRVVFGGVYDATTHRVHVPSGLYEELDLSTESKVSLPIPFASGWSLMNLERGRLQFVYNSFGSTNQYFVLRPVGALVTTTLRNTSSEDVTLQGLDIQTNSLHMGQVALDFSSGELYTSPVSFSTSGYSSLTVGQLPTSTQVGAYEMPVSGDTFYRMQLVPRAGRDISLPRQERTAYSVSPRVFVLWGMPVEGKRMGAANETPETNLRGISFFNYAQTHLYARGVKRSDGTAVTKPNYEVVPVMGTDYAFVSGRSYTLNAELFDQPNVLLGYFAKYTLNEDGETFATSHERQRVQFVNYQTAREFAREGKELTMPGTTERVRYYLPTAANLSVLGVHAGPAIKTQRGGGTQDYGAYLGQSWPSGVRAELAGFRHDASGAIDFGSVEIAEHSYLDGRMYAHRAGDLTVAYGITNKARVYGANLDRSAQADQTLWRYKLETGDDLDVRALFVGKYFVGNPYSPIYRGADLLNEAALWGQAEATRNQVERYISSRGAFNSPAITDAHIAQRNFPFQRATPQTNNLPVYWALANGYGTNRLLYWWYKGQHTSLSAVELKEKLLSEYPLNAQGTPELTAAPINSDGAYRFAGGELVYRWRDYPVNWYAQGGVPWGGVAAGLGTYNEALVRSRMFQPLLLVSKVYQGDSKD